VLEHLVFFAISLGVLVGGVLWRLRSARPAPADEARPAISWRERLLDLGLIALLGVPPLLGCILVYPHPHYIVIFELAACLFVARALRGVGPDLPPVLAIAISVGFILATRPLPVIHQPTLQIIEALRRLPPMRGLIATDGRWCVYLQRPCATYPPDFFQTTSLKDETIGAVLLSPTIVNYQKDHPNSSLQFPFDSSNHPGWTSYRLDEGFSIFYRLPAGNALQ
jgi:hypothetical protein